MAEPARQIGLEIPAWKAELDEAAVQALEAQENLLRLIGEHIFPNWPFIGVELAKLAAAGKMTEAREKLGALIV